MADEKADDKKADDKGTRKNPRPVAKDHNDHITEMEQRSDKDKKPKPGDGKK